MFGNGHESMITSFVKWRPAGEILNIDVGAGFDQFSHAPQIVLNAGQMKLRLSLFVALIQSLDAC